MSGVFEFISLWQAGHQVLRVTTGHCEDADEVGRLKQMPLQLDRVEGPPRRLVLRAGSTVVREIDEASLSVFQLSPLILRDFGEPLELLTQQPVYGHVAQPRADGDGEAMFPTLIWLASCVAPVALKQSQALAVVEQSIGHKTTD